MKRQWKGFVSGVLVSVLLVGLIGTALATVGQNTVTVDYNDIKVTLNGEAVNLVDANGAAVEPFAINGTTYLPVRAVSSALGLDVNWDGETKTIILSGDGGDGVTPDFKVAMDSFVDFFETYADFMKKRDTTDDMTAWLKDYSSFLSQYSETMQKLNAIEGQALSPADKGYYAYTMAKVAELLSAVSGQ